MRKVEELFGVVIVLVITALLAIVTINVFQAWQGRQAKPAPSDPSGIWAGLVDDLPSGRMVECVFARDPSGSVAVTCDWQNAVRRP